MSTHVASFLDADPEVLHDLRSFQSVPLVYPFLFEIRCPLSVSWLLNP